MSDRQSMWEKSGEFRMGLWEEKNRIWVDFGWNPEMKEAVKNCTPGGKWDATEKWWHFPLDMDAARDLRNLARQWNYRIVVLQSLATWAKNENARYSNLIKPDDITADASAWLPRCRRERPEMIAAMESKPWQIPGAAFMVGQRHVLLADQPGLGKTLMTLAAVVELDVRGPILVVAPRTAANVTWPDEIRKWLGPSEVVFVINSTLKPKERKELVQSAKLLSTSGRVWVICGPNYLRIRADLDDDGNYLRDSKGKKIVRVVNEGVPDLFRVDWSAVIVDESHQTLAGATGNPKKQSAQRRGLGALNIDPSGLHIAISGTPFRGKTENGWGTLNWLEPTKYTSYWNWIDRHYGKVQNNKMFGPSVVKGDSIKDERRFFAELAPIMVRRTKAEVAPWLPPKSYAGRHLVPGDISTPVAVWLPMSAPQQKQYDQIVREAIINISEMVEVNVNGALAEMVRFKQLANACLGNDARWSTGIGPEAPSNKIDWIVDFLEDRKGSGIKTIVASQFTQFIELLSVELANKDIGHYVFTGKTKDDARSRIKNDFQALDGHEVILLNTKSGGVSLTLDAADDVIICDQTWVPDDQEQVEDRSHRISRNHKVTVHYLASLNTIDEDIAVVNNEREDAIIGILDRARGVQYVKALVAATKARAAL